MQTLETWIGRISVFCISLILLAMMLQVVVDVTMRTILGAGFPATADLVGRYYMVGISLLPLALTEIGRRHIEATIFTSRLQGLAQNAVFFLGFAIGLVVFATLTYGTTLDAMRQTSRGAYIEAGAIHFLTWPSYWIPPAAFGLMSLILMLRLIELITGQFKDGTHDPLEEVEHHSGEAS